MNKITLLKEKKWWILQGLLLIALIFIVPYVYQNAVYGDKTDVIKEMESHKENKLVTDDENSLNVALAVQKAIRNVAQSVSPSVVNIRTERIVKNRRHYQDGLRNFFGDGPQKLQSLGSGFVISEKGYIVTNSHVVQDADEITILFPDEKEYSGKIVGRDPKTDIAVIKINPDHKLPVTPLGNSDQVEIGDFAIAIGNPFGLNGTFTLGVISARGRDKVDQDAGFKNYIQTDASINQGNSGGPLLNIKGQGIGMNTAIYSTTGGSVGIGFAIPMNIVKEVVAKLIEKGSVDRGYLGVTISPLSKEVANHLGVSKKSGVFIQDIESGGPADKATIKPGDVITKVGNKVVRSVSQLQRVISSYPKGKTTTIQILRNGKEMDLKVTLGEMSKNKVVRAGKKYVGPSKEFLGLVAGSVQDNFRYFRLNRQLSGVVVVEIGKDSPAAASGLRVRDVIQEINYKKIKTMKDFEDFINKNKGQKESYLLRVKRRGTNQYVVIENS
ncbi:MAG: protease Do [bacterium]|nr:MAG: protease Do [bacterium]